MFVLCIWKKHKEKYKPDITVTFFQCTVLYVAFIVTVNGARVQHCHHQTDWKVKRGRRHWNIWNMEYVCGICQIQIAAIGSALPLAVCAFVCIISCACLCVCVCTVGVVGCWLRFSVVQLFVVVGFGQQQQRQWQRRQQHLSRFGIHTVMGYINMYTLHTLHRPMYVMNGTRNGAQSRERVAWEQIELHYWHISHAQAQIQIQIHKYKHNPCTLTMNWNAWYAWTYWGDISSSSSYSSSPTLTHYSPNSHLVILGRKQTEYIYRNISMFMHFIHSL